MYLASVNKAKRLLCLSFIGKVEAEELARGLQDLAALLSELEPGFRVLADLERLDSIGVGGAAEIGKAMELCDQKGVGLVVRVIPDHTKDIGFGILTLFHYRQAPHTMTCKTMIEAAKALGI